MPDLFTTDEAGVTVTKHVDASADEVQIGFRLDSSRDRPLTVRVRDAVPTETSVEVPTTDPSHWSVADDAVEYERTLDPEGAVTTGYVYACDGEGTDSVSHQPPTLAVDGDAAQADGETVRGDTGAAAEQTATAGPEATDASRPAGSEQATPSQAAAEEDEFEMPEDEVTVGDIVGASTAASDTVETHTTATDDVTAPATQTFQAAASATDAAAGDGETTADDNDSIDDRVETVLQLLDADATPAQRDRLAQELGALDGSRSSLDLRVTHLQSQFQDLAAYLDAMEEFLDDHGAGEDVLTEVLDELHAVRGHLECVQDEQAALNERLAAIEDRTDRLESSFESRHDAVESNLRHLETTVEDVEATQQTVQEQVAQFAAFRDAIRGAFQSEALSSDD